LFYFFLSNYYYKIWYRHDWHHQLKWQSWCPQCLILILLHYWLLNFLQSQSVSSLKHTPLLFLNYLRSWESFLIGSSCTIFPLSVFYNHHYYSYVLYIVISVISGTISFLKYILQLSKFWVSVVKIRRNLSSIFIVVWNMSWSQKIFYFNLSIKGFIFAFDCLF